MRPVARRRRSLESHMDLRSHLLELAAPLEPGDEILPGITLRGASTELGLRLTFSSDTGDLHVEVTPAEEGAPHAARTARLLLGYRSAGGAGRIEAELGLELCRAVASLVERNEARVLERIAEAADQARSTGEAGVRIREV